MEPIVVKNGCITIYKTEKGKESYVWKCEQVWSETTNLLRVFGNTRRVVLPV